MQINRQCWYCFYFFFSFFFFFLKRNKKILPFRSGRDIINLAEYLFLSKVCKKNPRLNSSCNMSDSEVDRSQWPVTSDSYEIYEQVKKQFSKNVQKMENNRFDHEHAIDWIFEELFSKLFFFFFSVLDWNRWFGHSLAWYL